MRREGYEKLSLQADKDGQRRRKPDPENEMPEETPRTKKKRGAPAEVGNALRSAYQRVINEDIPPEMLDLLGKLG